MAKLDEMLDECMMILKQCQLLRVRVLVLLSQMTVPCRLSRLQEVPSYHFQVNYSALLFVMIMNRVLSAW